MALHLLDSNGNFVAGRSRFGGTVDEHVCLLLLFDGYDQRRCVCADDRAYFVQTLLHTHPFGVAYRRGVNRGVPGGLLIFSAPVSVPAGKTHRFSPTCDPAGLYNLDSAELETFIAGLSYGSFLDGRATWLTPGMRSHGMVAVALNGFRGRDGFESGTASYFTVTASSRERMARVLLHELGHAFELADEYEEKTRPCEASGNRRTPNVVYRGAIESPPSTVPRSNLAPASVRLDQIPWARYVNGPIQVIEHPRRARWAAIPPNPAGFNCVVGSYEQEPPVAPQTFAALWEGGDHHSFNVYRAEPYCIMRDQYYAVYDPSPPPPTKFSAIYHNEGITEINLLGDAPWPPDDPPAPESSFCGLAARDPGEPRNFSERVGNAFVPYCVACEHYIQYRFGNTTGSDGDEWQIGHSPSARLDAYQRWLTLYG